jgi:hypothetical protein
MFKIGDIVKTNSINGETFTGKIVDLDRFGFACVSFENVSESRIAISQLEKGE